MGAGIFPAPAELAALKSEVVLVLAFVLGLVLIGLVLSLLLGLVPGLIFALPILAFILHGRLTSLSLDIG